MNEDVQDLKRTINKLRRLVELKDQLLACYRLGIPPGGDFLDELNFLTQWERTVK